MARITKHEYYLGIAAAVAARGTCKVRNYGAVIVKEDHVISEGYTGSPRGLYNCIDHDEICERIRNGSSPGQDFGTCRSVHAEMNAIISASRLDMLDATMYLANRSGLFGHQLDFPEPCQFCRRMILNTGISKVVVGGTIFDNKVGDGARMITMVFTREDLIRKEEG